MREPWGAYDVDDGRVSCGARYLAINSDPKKSSAGSTNLYGHRTQ